MKTLKFPNPRGSTNPKKGKHKENHAKTHYIHILGSSDKEKILVVARGKKTYSHQDFFCQKLCKREDNPQY